MLRIQLFVTKKSSPRMTLHSCIKRAEKFASDNGIENPILLGPMAGACPVSLSIAVAKGGGMGACGALLMHPEKIKKWAQEFRSITDAPFQMNLWIPDAEAPLSPEHEKQLRTYLNNWGPEVSADATSDTLPNFQEQCAALLDIAPPAISSIMGLFDESFVAQIKERGIKWFANVSTLEEAVMAEAAGADVVVAKGYEGGGHSGAFNPDNATRCGVGLLSLIPAIADSVKLPIVAAGGIADGRTMASTLLLGASAVQIGTGFLRAPESTIAPAWSDAIGVARPEDTMITKAYSGRAGRSIATKYALAMAQDDTPEPAPYPTQRALTHAMRTAAVKENRLEAMQAWAGQSAGMAQVKSATKITRNIWASAKALCDKLN